MKDFLAEQLLVKIMNWNSEEISEERPLLQALANLKYNEYQQFSAGIRFIESLVRWLGNFNELEERKVAYQFIKDELIFISNTQILYLVSIAFNDKINPVLLKKTASLLGISEFLVQHILNSKEYKDILRKSLFIGLSDGSRIDSLRRFSGINNEQVLTTHEISPDKAEDLLAELKKSIGQDCKFDTVFLVDDFTASGKSFFRPEEGKGKILKFLTNVFNPDPAWSDLTDKDALEIHIIFYIATRDALNIIQSNIDKWKLDNNILNIINVYSIQILESTIKEKIELNKPLMALAEKYFDKGIAANKHYVVGKHEKPYLGFNECGLPVVLCHNTPNNSLPILWSPEEMQYQGLFPRVTRHK